ncbi:hypothetical protein KEM55_001718, partial [Ascosphaera atra]
EEHAEEESAGEAGEQQSDAVESKADVQEGANVASSGDVNEEHAETEVKETAETEGKEDLAQSVKDMDLDDSNGDDKEEEEPQPQPTPQPKAKQAGKSSQKPSNTPPAKPQKVRGKRGKLQKIAEKYKDQDEEDRANALAFLGSTGKKEPATAVPMPPAPRHQERARTPQPKPKKSATPKSNSKKRAVGPSTKKPPKPSASGWKDCTARPAQRTVRLKPETTTRTCRCCRASWARRWWATRFSLRCRCVRRGRR